MRSLSTLALLAAVPVSASDKACCTGACPLPGQKKYWSIAASIFGTKHCGECCMLPKQYGLYHFFEKNLTLSEDSDYPCAERGYPKYDSTVTHGVWPVTMTLDLYDLPKSGREPLQESQELAVQPQEFQKSEKTEAATAKPCCQGHCPVAGHRKYWSIAKSVFGTPHCGECCMDPSKYKLYHFFESNLTLSETDTPCAERGYGKYDSTVTHGVWPVTMTLDLYDHAKSAAGESTVLV